MSAETPIETQTPPSAAPGAPAVPDATVSRGRDALALHPVARLPEEWKEVMLAWGEKPFRAKQIFRWIHERGVLDPEAMTDLSRSLRQKLAEGGLAEPGR